MIHTCTCLKVMFKCTDVQFYIFIRIHTYFFYLFILQCVAPFPPHYSDILRRFASKRSFPTRSTLSTTLLSNKPDSYKLRKTTLDNASVSIFAEVTLMEAFRTRCFSLLPSSFSCSVRACMVEGFEGG